MTINPVAAVKLIQAIVRAIRARRAKRRHDIEAIGRIEERVVERLPDRPTDQE